MFYQRPPLTQPALGNDFVSYCNRYIDAHHSEYFLITESQREERIRKFYHEGFFVHQVLECSFFEFHRAVISRTDIGTAVEKSDYGNFWHRKYRKIWDYPYRERRAYRRLPHHGKKEKDTAKQDWWDKKGFMKDKQRHNNRGPASGMMRMGNKSMRRTVRTRLASGNFEKAMQCDDHRDFYNPWMWD